MDIGSLSQRYQAGASLKDLSALAGVSPQTVGRRLVAAGVTLRGKKKTAQQRAHMSYRRTIPLPVDQLRAWRDQEMSTRDMGARLGVSEETVRQRMIDHGVERLPAKARPQRNPFWRGGYSVDQEGYILAKCPDHPQATAKGYVRMHRLVVEQSLGRPLLPTEVVDHRNGDPSDNRPENLRVFQSNGDHLSATLRGTKNLTPEQRERVRREAVRRARRRVAAILAESETGGDR